MRLGLLIYGSLETLSGGYLYDKKLVEYLRKHYDTVDIVSIPFKNYPCHLVGNFSPVLRSRLADLDVDILLQDELIHPSLFLINRSYRGKTNYLKVSIVHHLRSSEEHSPELLWFYRRIEASYLRTIDAFIFNSQTTRYEVEHLVGNKEPAVVATPAGDRFGSGLEEVHITARAKQVGPLRLLFLGNLIRRKGLHNLLAALAHMKNEDWLLSVAGCRDVDTVYAREVEGLVQSLELSSRVIFLGETPDSNIGSLLHNSHVLVVPSFYEGFGIVYLEAMAYGVVPIASSAGGGNEIVQNNKNGFLVNPGDSATLESQLRHLCRNRDILLELALSARRRFDEFPGWEQTCARIHFFLHSLKTNL
ncbi:glycosyltransferase [hydrocarbon metagenome]|uniref:Glycosyltransferase n=1 Tax=hydrocarbon metagenome TaxID=938273 RepID=A0A0W8FPG4_9ZZZZ